jgi:hypothetical protein
MLSCTSDTRLVCFCTAQVANGKKGSHGPGGKGGKGGKGAGKSDARLHSVARGGVTKVKGMPRANSSSAGGWVGPGNMLHTKW